MASLEPCPQRSFPIPDLETSLKRPLDFTPVSAALASFRAEQVASVEAAIKGKTVLEISGLLAHFHVQQHGDEKA